MQTQTTFLVGVGVSAKDLELLPTLFAHLPDTLLHTTSFIIAQHISITDRVVLFDKTHFATKEAENNEVIKTGVIYIYPPHFDIQVSDGIIILNKIDTVTDIQLANTLFISLANSYTKNSVAISLFEDEMPIEGLKTVKNHKGYVIVPKKIQPFLDDYVSYSPQLEEIGKVLEKITHLPAQTYKERYKHRRKSPQSLQTQLREAQNSIFQRDEMLGSLLNSSTSYLIRMDMRGSYTYVNDAFCEKFGFTPEQYIGKDYRPTVHPDDLGECEKAVAELFQQPTAVTYAEMRKPNPNGGYFHTAWEFVIIHNQAGEFAEVQGVGRDITALKLNEAQLEKEHSKLEMIILGGQIGTWDWDLTTNQMTFDARWAEILGYEPTEINMDMQAWQNLIHPEDKDKVWRAIQANIKGDTPYYEIEHRKKAKNGEWKWLVVTGKVVERDEHGKALRLTGVHQDITNRKHDEEYIKISDDRNTSVLNRMYEGIVIQDMTSAILSCNNSAQRILGLTYSQLVGKSSIDKDWHAVKEDGSPFPGEEHPAMVTIRTGEPQNDVIMGVHKPNDELTWIAINSQLLYHPETKMPYAVFTVFHDITERKKAENNLKASQEKYRKVIETQTDFVLISEPDTTITYTNEGMCKALGVSQDQIVGKKWLDFADPDDLQPTLKKIAKLSSKKPDFLTENRDTRAKGIIGWTQWINQGIFDEYGKLIQIQSIGRDITDLKYAEQIITESNAELAASNEELRANFEELVKAQQTIRESEQSLSESNAELAASNEELRANFEELLKAQQTIKESEQSLKHAQSTAKIGGWKFDLNTNHLTWSEEHYRIFELAEEIPKDELYAAYRSKIHPDDIPSLDKVIQNAIEKGEGFVYEHRVLCNDGNIKYVVGIGEVVIDTHNKFNLLMGTVQDITQRKIAEIALEVEKERFQDIVDSTEGIVWEIDFATMQFTYVSQQAVRLLGYEVEAWCKPDFWVSNLHPDDKLWVVEYSFTRSQRLEAHDFQYRFFAKDGREVWLRNIVTVVAENDKPILLRGIMVDITARKHAEQAILKTTERLLQLEKFINLTTDGIQVSDETGYLVYLNEVASERLGIPQNEAHKYKVADFEKIFYKEGEWEKHIHTLQNTEFITVEGINLNQKKGRAFPVEVTIRFVRIYEKGYVIAISRDITERKNAEKEKTDLLQRFEKIAKHTPGILCQFKLEPNGESHFPYISAKIQELIGISPEQLQKSATPLFELIPKEHLVNLLNSIQQSAETNTNWRQAYKVEKGENDFIWLEVNATPQKMENGSVAWYGYANDITERKKMEEVLYRLSMVAKRTSDMVIITDKDRKIIWVNEAVEHITGYTSKEIIGKSPRMFQFEDTNMETIRLINDKLTRYEPVRCELLNKGKNGSIYWLEIEIQPLFDNQDQLTGFMSIQSDVTARKEAEQKIKAQNEALREIAFTESHILRRPLANVLGLCNLLEMAQQEKNFEQINEYVTLLLISARETDEVIHQIVSKANKLEVD